MSAKEDSMSERSLLILKEQDHWHRWNDVETGAFFLHSSLSRRQRVVNAICILVMKLCERLTLFGVVANLLLFCRNVLKLDSPWPSTIALSLQGWFTLSS